MSKTYALGTNEPTKVNTIINGAMYFVGISRTLEKYLVSGIIKNPRIIYVIPIATNGPYPSIGFVSKMSGPNCTPWYSKTTAIIAAVAPPGTPIINRGIKVPEVTPLLEDSGAIRPSGWPVP